MSQRTILAFYLLTVPFVVAADELTVGPAP